MDALNVALACVGGPGRKLAVRQAEVLQAVFW